MMLKYFLSLLVGLSVGVVGGTYLVFNYPEVVAYIFDGAASVWVNVVNFYQSVKDWVSTLPWFNH